MSEIILRGLSKSFQTRGRRVEALIGASFDVAEGELLVLLGPSGCGKTTTLRCLAGLEDPTEGSIAFGSRLLYDKARRVNVPTHKRNLGLVFQSFALWPHLTARQNIEYPLRARRVPSDARRGAVEELAQLVNLDDRLLDNRPGQLSGGQQQRVALARALVGSPSVLLFDEPLSSLDTRLREQLRTDLRLLHRRMGFTGVYVTHDLQEALALGDKVAVMYAGRVRQFGEPTAVFEAPNSVEVAEIVGYRRLVAIRRSNGAWTLGGGRIEGPLPPLDNSPEVLLVYARPSRVLVRPESAPQEPGTLRIGGWRVDEIEPSTDFVNVVISKGADSAHISADAAAITGITRGASVGITLQAERTHFFAQDGSCWRAGAWSRPDNRKVRGDELVTA